MRFPVHFLQCSTLPVAVGLGEALQQEEVELPVLGGALVHGLLDEPGGINAIDFRPHVVRFGTLLSCNRLEIAIMYFASYL